LYEFKDFAFEPESTGLGFWQLNGTSFKQGARGKLRGIA